MPESVPCRWCGMEMPADAKTCPWCNRPAAPAADGPPRPPTHEAPPEPVVGQEEFGTVASLRSLARHDPAMFAVVLLVAFDAAIALGTGDWLGFALGLVILYGVLQWTWWAFWLVVLGKGLTALRAVLILARIGLGLTRVQWLFEEQLIVAVFVLVVLIARRDRFD